MKKTIFFIGIFISLQSFASSPYDKWASKKAELDALEKTLFEKMEIIAKTKDPFTEMIKNSVIEDLTSQGKEISDEIIAERAKDLSSEMDQWSELFFSKKNEALFCLKSFFSDNKKLISEQIIKLSIHSAICNLLEIILLIEKINVCAKELNTIVNVSDKLSIIPKARTLLLT